MHTGNLQSAIHAVVDHVLEKSDRRMLSLCDICRQPYASHSHDLAKCPSPLDSGPLFLPTRFVEMTCQAAEGSGEEARQCGRTCVTGTEFCLLHSEE